MKRNKIIWGLVGLVILAVHHYYKNADARACERELKYEIRSAPEYKDELINSCVESVKELREKGLAN